jgi:hypothetical protein
MGAPLLRGSHHAFDWSVVKQGYIVAASAVRCRNDLEQRNCYQLRLLSRFLLAAVRSHNFKVLAMRSPEPSLYFRHYPHNIFAAQTSASPEIPTPGITGKISKFNVAMRRRFLRTPFPAGYRHRGGLQSLAKYCLI